MKAEILYYLGDMYRDPEPALENIVDNLISHINFKFPADYVELMTFSRAWEGEIGPNGWLNLFPLENILQTNVDYVLLMEEIPDYFLIGKDAADTGFALHKFNQTYHAFGLMSNFDTDPIEFCGNNLTEFLAIYTTDKGAGTIQNTTLLSSRV